MRQILVIEDDLIHAKLIEKALVKQGYELFICDNANEGIEIAREVIPDIIFLDVSLPGIDGIEAIEIIRKDPNLSHIPILVITATRTTEMEHLVESAGANAYFPKPFDLEELRKVTARFFS